MRYNLKIPVIVSRQNGQKGALESGWSIVSIVVVQLSQQQCPHIVNACEMGSLKHIRQMRRDPVYPEIICANLCIFIFQVFL